MTRIEVLKYYGHGKYYDVPAAQKAVDDLKKKHPDREYTLMTNMRSGYTRPQVVQIKRETLDWPSPEDLGFPAEEPDVSMFSSQDVYMHEVARRRNAMQNAVKPLTALLKRKLNP